jgi:hypothetical protein
LAIALSPSFSVVDNTILEDIDGILQEPKLQTLFYTPDDEHKYKPFSYDTNSCHRNHRRSTLCDFHYAEEHEGSWQDCPQCKAAFETGVYVYCRADGCNRLFPE